MPSGKVTTAAEAASARMPSSPEELIDQFFAGPMSEEAVHGILMAFKKAPLELALSAKLSHHLGYHAVAATMRWQQLLCTRIVPRSVKICRCRGKPERLALTRPDLQLQRGYVSRYVTLPSYTPSMPSSRNSLSVIASSKAARASSV